MPPYFDMNFLKIHCDNHLMNDDRDIWDTKKYANKNGIFILKNLNFFFLFLNKLNFQLSHSL